jgi:hypothetical protein
MDPFTALSLAAAIVQFLDFSTKIVKGAREVYFSTTGSTEENASVELVVTEMRSWFLKLAYSDHGGTKEEEAICTLAAECQKISGQILDLIKKTKPSSQKSEIKVLFAALRDRWHQYDKRQLQKRLNNCRRQLEVQLVAFDRS